MDARGPRQEALLVLGLVDPVSEPEITNTYRNLAKRLHPDVVPAEQADPARFAAVHDAYALLRATPASKPLNPPHPDRAPIRVSPGTRWSNTWITIGPPMVIPPHPGRRRP